MVKKTDRKEYVSYGKYDVVIASINGKQRGGVFCKMKKIADIVVSDAGDSIEEKIENMLSAMESNLKFTDPDAITPEAFQLINKIVETEGVEYHNTLSQAAALEGEFSWGVISKNAKQSQFEVQNAFECCKSLIEKYITLESVPNVDDDIDMLFGIRKQQGNQETIVLRPAYIESFNIEDPVALLSDKA
jgi:hypothetical protein